MTTDKTPAAPAARLSGIVDELDDVLAMQSFFLDAIEALTHHAGDGITRPDSHDGLGLWARHLQERGITLKQRIASATWEADSTP